MRTHRRHLGDGPRSVEAPACLADTPAQVEQARRVVEQPDPLFLFPLLGHLKGVWVVVFRVQIYLTALEQISYEKYICQNMVVWVTTGYNPFEKQHVIVPDPGGPRVARRASL